MATNTLTNPIPEENLQTGGSSSEFLKTIQDKLLGQSGVVSSTSSILESRITAAISGVRVSTEAAGKAIESRFGREIGFQKETAAEAISAGRAAGAGGVLNLGALRSLTNTIDKSLKDLAQRREELILQNDALGAAKIADLEFKAIEFQQQAQQQVFSNLLGMANLGIQSAQEARLTRQQTFAENQATTGIALKYGLTLKPGETLADIATRAMPIASKEQQANLASLIANTNFTIAQTAKILNGEKTSVAVTPEIRAKLAIRWNEITQNGTVTPQPGSIQDIELANILDSFGTTEKKNEFFDEVARQARDGAKAIAEIKEIKKDSFSGVAFNPKTKQIESFTIDPFTGKKNFVGSPQNIQIDFSKLDFSKTKEIERLLNINKLNINK